MKPIGEEALPRVAHFAIAPTFVAKIMIHDLRRLKSVSDAVIITTAGEELEAVRAEGFRIFTVKASRKLSPLLDPITIRQVSRVLRAERVDVLHTYTPKAGLLGQIAGAMVGVKKRIHSCRGLLYTPGMPVTLETMFRITDSLTNRLASRVIYVSSADRTLSIKEGLCPEQKAVYTGSGIDLDHFSRGRFDGSSRIATRKRLGIDEDATLILTVGRFVDEKGYRELGSAAKSIARQHPGVKFVWVAPVLEGEERSLPDDYLATQGLSSIVLRLGLQADVAELYAAADLLVHPSYREGVPRAVMEAAAMGVPIVASDIPGCREVLQSESEAFFCKPRDIVSLTEAIDRALANPADARARARAAYERVRSEFDQNRLTARVWAVYREILDENGHCSP